VKLQTKHWILVITAPVVVILDQITKALARGYLKPLNVELHPTDRYVSVIDGFFRLKYAENAGAAWGLGANWSPTFRVGFFILVSIAAVFFILWFFRKLDAKQRLLALAVSLVLGGAVGNLLDRIFLNRVVDFIDWYIALDSPTNFLLFTARAGEHHWPTFNIADIGISVGVCLLAVEIIFGKRKSEDEAEPEQSAPADEASS
jgi:signal peptidase II